MDPTVSTTLFGMGSTSMIADLPRVAMSSFCVGRSRISQGIWYSPVGKTSHECTYCEFCINNGCIPVDQVYKIDPSIIRNCNCDCLNMSSHPLLRGLECPKCMSEGEGMMRCASCGTCKNCNGVTPYVGQSYCTGCSWKLESCHECGEPIKDGNEYVKDINDICEERITRSKDQIKRSTPPEDRWIKYHQGQIKSMEETQKKLSELYTGKSKKETLEMIIKGRSEIHIYKLKLINIEVKKLSLHLMN